MPKLKKFRVVNLVYNETRHIYDETFDFNEGKHTMMLLANGGGKTVLTQMMLQPVIPKTDLKTRKFIDYFKHNKRPTLLMSEWLLDDGISTLLTGLVIKNRIRTKRGNQDTQETLDITTFTIAYHYSETYKIETIPITFRDSTGRKSMYDYDAIVNDIKKHEQKFKQYVSVFNWSDSREAKDQYGRKLAEYGIVQQEWKDNILKINKEEAGLKSFFEDAKTGSTLLKKKILPTIESKLDENAKDKVEIQSVFKKHAIELVNNKKIINNEKLYKEFLGESLRFEEKAYKANKAKEDYIKSIGQVQRFHIGLGRLKVRVNQSITRAQKDMLDNRRMITRIAFEEECFKYYKKQLDYKRLFEEIKIIKVTLNQLEQELNTMTYKEKVLYGSKVYKELCEVQKQLNLKREEYDRLMHSEEALDYQQLNNVLYLKFNDRLEEISNLMKGCDIKTKTLQVTINDLNSNKVTYYKNKRIKEDDQAVFKNKTEEFESFVVEMSRKNEDFQWGKHPLYNDYDVFELNEYLEQIGQKLASNSDTINESKKQVLIKEKEVEVNLINIQKTKIEESKEIQKLKYFKDVLEDYLEKEAKIYDQLKMLQIDKKELFDQDYIYNQIDGIIRGKDERYNHLTIERAMNEQISESLREGKLISLPESVTEFLKEHNIIFEYGFDWLKNHEGDIIPNSLYMEQLNMLPYALVMDSGNYKQFVHMTKEYHMNMVLPVINEELIHTVLEENSIEWVDGLFFHTAFEEKLLEKEYVTSQIDLLTEKHTDIIEEQNLIIKSRKHYYNMRSNYESFTTNFQEKSKENYSCKVIESEELTLTYQTTIIELEAKLAGLKEEINTLVTSIISLEEVHESLQIKKKVYDQLKDKYLVYKEDKKQLNEAQGLVVKLEKDIKTCEKELDFNQEKIRQIQDKWKILKDENQRISKECSVLGELKVSEEVRQLTLFEKSIDELMIKQEVFKRALGDIRSIEEILNVYKQQEDKLVVELKTLELNDEDYKNRIYDEVLYQEVKAKKEQINQEKNQTNTQVIKKESELEVTKKNLDHEKEDILSKPDREELIESEAIVNTDFKVRKLDNQNEYKHIKEMLSDLEKLRSETEQSEVETELNIEDSIHDLVEKSRIGMVEVNEEHIRPIDIRTKRQRLLKEMQEQQREADRKQQELNNAYVQLKVEYYGKNDLLNNMFNHLLKESSLNDFEFVKRVLKQTNESIERRLDKYSADIKALKDKEANLFNFVINKVSDVYDELAEIDRHSIIELNEKRQKMLYIQLPKKEMLDTNRLQQYLQDVIRVARNKYEKQELQELDKYLDSHLKLEQLFDEYVSIGSIQINISKIEQNKVSKMSWEEVGKASGGELFVSVFIVFSSLLSYTRGYQLSRKQQGNVLVMDNPFGPVSSEHLLEPLFKIAETYDTQMICFTHINTSGITNQFDLIYSLRVVQEGGSGREHMEVELAKDKTKEIERLDSGKFEIGSGDQVGFL